MNEGRKERGRNSSTRPSHSCRHQFVYVFGGSPEDKSMTFNQVYVLDLEVRMEWEKIMPEPSARAKSVQDWGLCRMGHTMTTITSRWSPESQYAGRRKRASGRVRAYRSEKILILGGNTNGPWDGSQPSPLQNDALLLCYRRGERGGSWEWHEADRTGFSQGPITNSQEHHNPLSPKAEPFAMAAKDKIKGTAEDARQLRDLAGGGLISHTADYFELDDLKGKDSLKV